jgi:hypothetical protein
VLVAAVGEPQTYPDCGQLYQGRYLESGIPVYGTILAGSGEGPLPVGPLPLGYGGRRADGTEGDRDCDGAEQGPEPCPMHGGGEGRLHPLAVARPLRRPRTDGLAGADRRPWWRKLTLA